MAQRVAQEQGVRVGGGVGYSVRFDEKCSGATRIKVCCTLLSTSLHNTLFELESQHDFEQH